MKKMRDFPQILQDAWALHEALQRLGFESKDIFVHLGLNGREPESGPWMFVVLKTQDKEFTIDVDKLGAHDPDRLTKLWHEFCGLLNEGKFITSEMQRVFHARFLSRPPGAHSLAIGLLDKGFTFPVSKEKQN